MLARMSHFDNFARLHSATAADLDSFVRFVQSVPAPAPEAEQWKTLLGLRRVRVLLATESHLTVGACVVLHPLDSARAKLLWLGVTPAARGRGIGAMLIDAAIDQLRMEGAALFTAKLPPESEALKSLLAQQGFRPAAPLSTTLALSLWNGRSAASYSTFDVPACGDWAMAEPGIRATMLFMATLDPRFQASLRVERQLRDEALLHPGQSMALRCASLAARRGYTATLHAGAAAINNAMQHQINGPLCFEPGLPSAEQLVGLLSRRRLPILQVRFPRLMTRSGWLMVTGFDGYLFRLALCESPSRSESPCTVTLAEMRKALRAPDAAGLVLGKTC